MIFRKLLDKWFALHHKLSQIFPHIKKCLGDNNLSKPELTLLTRKSRYKIKITYKKKLKEIANLKV